MSGIRTTDVFITGFGAATGLGDEAALAEAMRTGTSAVAPFEGSHEDLPPGFGAPVALKHKDLRALPGGRGLRPGTLTAYSFLGVLATGRALLDAGLTAPDTDEPATMDRRGVYLGAYTNFPEMKKHLKLVHYMGDPAAAEAGDYIIDDGRILDGMKGFSGFDFLKLMNNMPTAHASIQAGARGPANTLLGHASVGLQAIGRAWDAIRLGIADQMVAGGCGPGTLEGLCLVHHARGVFADGGDDVARASRPLDGAAGGLVPGDAGAAVVLETPECAVARGGTPRARLAAYSEAFAVPVADRGPFSAGPVAALLRDLLAQAGWEPGDVDAIAATGSGLPALDAVEAEALGAVFGPAAPVILPSALCGWTEAGSGPLGLVALLQAMASGELPATWHLDSPLSGLQDAARGSATSKDISRGVVLSVSPEGSLAALAIERA